MLGKKEKLQIRRLTNRTGVKREAKRITIVLDDELYIKLVEYTARRSKRDLSRFSLSESIRDLLSHDLVGRHAGDVERR